MNAYIGIGLGTSAMKLLLMDAEGNIHNLCLNENGVPANQQKQYERIMQGKTLPDGYSLTINNRKDLRMVCSWVVTLPVNVQVGDDRKFFQSVYDHLKNRRNGI